MARLGEIATYVNGFAFKPSDWSESGIPIIRIQDLTGNSYQANRYDGPYEKKYEVVPGDVLISWSASLGVYVWRREKAVLNQHIFKVVFNKVEVNKSFFVHQVGFILENASWAAHGATMKHLTKPVFDALPFYLPRIEKQNQIAEVLDILANLISLRKRQLAKLDELVKARFVEMFGDPEYNTKHWPVYTLDKLCEVGSSKRIYQNEQSSEGVSFWRISDLVNKMDAGLADSGLFIPNEKYDELKQAGLVPVAGDILVTSRGTLGRCYIIEKEDRFYFQDGMISWLSHYSHGITPLYLQFLFSMPGFRRQIDNMQAGSTVAYLSIAMLKKLCIMVPCEETQTAFASFIAQIGKSKFTMQQGMIKLEILKKALMQKYFG